MNHVIITEQICVIPDLECDKSIIFFVFFTIKLDLFTSDGWQPCSAVP